MAPAVDAAELATLPAELDGPAGFVEADAQRRPVRW